jgi:signal peptidase I
MMKALRCCGWVFFVGVGLLLLVRTFFMRPYYVDSPSMEPTLHGAESGGDHALVLFGKVAVVRRGEVVVILPADESEPLVKRALGLPGEAIAIHSGDVWIDGKILRTQAVLPVPITIFDFNQHDFTVDFRVPSHWIADPQGWTVNASKVGPRDLGACSFMRLGLKDHYLVGPDGHRVPGLDDVGDALIEFHLESKTEGFSARVGLLEKGDRFEVIIDLKSFANSSLRLMRNGSEVLRSDHDWTPGAHELRFGNVNNRLTFDLDGRRVFTHDYPENIPKGDERAGSSPSPTRDRVYLGGHGGVGHFSGMRVFRDIHYTPLGEFAVGTPLQLGPREIFLLGDNSRESRDGREWGPTPLSEVIGRPIQVVWPTERFGPLPGSQSNWEWRD